MQSSRLVLSGFDHQALQRLASYTQSAPMVWSAPSMQSQTWPTSHCPPGSDLSVPWHMLLWLMELLATFPILTSAMHAVKRFNQSLCETMLSGTWSSGISTIGHRSRYALPCSGMCPTIGSVASLRPSMPWCKLSRNIGRPIHPIGRPCLTDCGNSLGLLMLFCSIGHREHVAVAEGRERRP